MLHTLLDMDGMDQFWSQWDSCRWKDYRAIEREYEYKRVQKGHNVKWQKWTENSLPTESFRSFVDRQETESVVCTEETVFELDQFRISCRA